MNSELSRHDLLSSEVSTFLLLGIFVVMLCVWLFTHRLKNQTGEFGRGWIFFAIRVGLASLVFWLGWQLLGRMFLLQTSWSLWSVSILGGVAVEVIAWLYQLEQGLVSTNRGRLLLSLRLGATATVLLMLVQPVLYRMREREITREVVILVDDSESMQLVDRQQTVSDQLAIASLFAPDLLKDRPEMKPIIRRITRIHRELNQQREALDRSESADTGLLESLLDTREVEVRELLDRIESEGKDIIAFLDRAENTRGIDGNSRSVLSDVQRRFRDMALRYVGEGRKQLDDRNHRALMQQLKLLNDQFSYALEKLPGINEKLDEGYYRNLSDSERKRVDDAASRPRSEIARQILLEPGEDGNALFQELADRYDLRFVRFGEEAAEFEGETWIEGGEISDPENAAVYRDQTNLTQALEETLAKVPAESLAGVLLLSDGQHNAEMPVEDPARQMGAQGSPLCVVPIGSRIGPRDASILNVTVPESIYLGDRLAVQAQLKLDGLAGKDVKAKLYFGDSLVDETELKVPELQYRTEVRFMHVPDQKGIFDYRLEIEPIEGELFADNNEWEFKAAVTDDRTNVLLVDSFPRWEFRYLRNLFYGRDKSVHLQYVLLEPDQITGFTGGPPVYASAGRAFGEAEATNLPRNEDEWRKFDAIIIGDVSSSAIDESTWRILRECVSSRGSLLIFIAGPRHFPHAIDNTDLQELLPVVYRPGEIPSFDTGERYQLELTAAGSNSMILQQSLSRSTNQQIWGGIPSMAWRFSPLDVKSGAEVLAYAVPEGQPLQSDLEFTGNPGNVQSALEKLANQKEYEKENALVVTQRFGRGRVVMLNFDSTWRFRYGVGDTYHHKFWGQMLRWGTGENLRSGGEFVRLGTDRLSYSPSAPIQVTAKILDRNRQPITGGAVYVSLFKGTTQLQRRPMTYREGSNGMFDATLNPLKVEGNYRLVLEGAPVDRAKNESGLERVETELIVSNTRAAAEYAELTADHDYLSQTAQLAGGATASIDDAQSLLSYFGEPKEVLQERNDLELWDKWPLLILFAGLVTSEWILRRQGGLA